MMERDDDALDNGLVRLKEYCGRPGTSDDDIDLRLVRARGLKGIVSCGHGRFLVEVVVIVPWDGRHDPESENGYFEWEGDRLLFQRFVMFSYGGPCVVWTKDSPFCMTDFFRGRVFIRLQQL
jgi:hypothetical protein